LLNELLLHLLSALSVVIECESKTGTYLSVIVLSVHSCLGSMVIAKEAVL